jgi:acrylyl-CoA reductase (NADPH)
MTAIPARFRAYVAERFDERVERGVRDFLAADLPPGEIEARVDWSSVNFKDALATTADGKVARISPLIPGIDLAGEVVASDDPGVPVGTAILAHGYDLGVARHGGYSAYTRVPAGYVVPLPPALGARDAMAVGRPGSPRRCPWRRWTVMACAQVRGRFS